MPNSRKIAGKTRGHLQELMDEIDNYGTAKMLIDQYGADTSIEAVMRVDAFI